MGVYQVIFQLKITLVGSKPPIWRRFELKDTMTFYQLHQIIQFAFDWEDYHLHGFDVRKTNGIAVNGTNSIGPIELDEFGFFNPDYDEEDIILKDVFIKEKDRVLYTYDFGDDWEHEIILEKILPEDSNSFYPRCTKVMRDTPNEDSRFQYLETGIVTEAVNGKEYMEELNEIFQEVFSEEQLMDREKHNSLKNENNDWTTLLDLIEEYKVLQPWNWMDDDQIFIVQDPETKELVYCSVLGKAGIEYGLAAFIGDKGHTFLQGLNKLENANSKFFMKQRSLHLSFSNRDELAPEDYQLLKAHGRSYRGKNQWPQIRSYIPGLYPWFLDEEEVRLFTIVLKQTIEVCKILKQNPHIIGVDDGTHYFARVFNEGAKRWESGEIALSPNENFRENLPLYINEFQMKKLKKVTKKFNTPVEFDCSYFFSPVQDFPNERPYYPKMILAVDKKRGLILFNDLMDLQNEVEAAQKGFVTFILQMESVPREVFVKKETAQSILQIAKMLNIKLIIVNSLPIIEDVQEGMEKRLF